MDPRLEQAKALYDRVGGPGNSGAVWQILELLIEYLRDVDNPWRLAGNETASDGTVGDGGDGTPAPQRTDT